MNFACVFRVVGAYLFMLAALILVGLGVSLYYEHFVSFVEHPQPHPTQAFLWAFLITLGA
ncbi:MAG TPA: hypothetical protein VN457_01765 [Chlamydiales bacterium]|nr:hypothetical protein [Chlamydiales bacterium]